MLIGVFLFHDYYYYYFSTLIWYFGPIFNILFIFLFSAAHRNLAMLFLTGVMEVVLICFLLSTLQRLPYRLESMFDNYFKTTTVLALKKKNFFIKHMLMKVITVFLTLVFCSCHACSTFNHLHIRSSGLTCEQHLFANTLASGTSAD